LCLNVTENVQQNNHKVITVFNDKTLPGTAVTLEEEWNYVLVSMLAEV
jgi:hypothetical protein